MSRPKAQKRLPTGLTKLTKPIVGVLSVLSVPGVGPFSKFETAQVPMRTPCSISLRRLAFVEDVSDLSFLETDTAGY